MIVVLICITSWLLTQSSSFKSIGEENKDVFRDEEILGIVIKQLVGTMISAKDLENFVKLNTSRSQIHIGSSQESTNGSHDN